MMQPYRQPSRDGVVASNPGTRTVVRGAADSEEAAHRTLTALALGQGLEPRTMRPNLIVMTIRGTIQTRVSALG